MTQKRTCCIKNLNVSRSVAEDWPSDSSTFDLQGCYISPWNVMQCYLESILQVRTSIMQIILFSFLHFVLVLY